MQKALCAWLMVFSYWLSANTQAEARLAIIIDDIGYNHSQSERAARLKGAFTLSVLPFTPHGLNSAQLAHNQGKELMLHLPMSAINYHSLGKGALVSGMEMSAFLTTLEQDLNSIPHIKGVNNHMGSRLTQELQPMQWLMAELQPRGLYFVDSRTSAQTIAFDTAKKYQVPSLKRDVFLDDINETNAIELELKRAMRLAHERGVAVAIGHPYPATLEVLERIGPLLEKNNITLVYASQLIVPPHTITTALPINTTPPKSAAPLFINPFNNKEPLFCPMPPTPLLIDLATGVDLYDNVRMMQK